MSTRLLFGGAVSVILLALYVFLVVYALLVVLQVGGITKASFTDQMSSALATIGGLISALVIAELALTQPGETPQARVFTAAWAGGGGGAGAGGPGGAGAGGGAGGVKASGAGGGPQPTSRTAQIVTYAYLVVWLASGLAAFFCGYLLHFSGLPALTDLGQSWMGLAVAAGYSYLGIRPG